MAFIQENNITINLNLKKEYKIIHFSDVHVVDLKNNETKEELDQAKNNEDAWYRVRKDFSIHFNETCNEEHMIPSTECLDNLLKYSNDINPDSIVMTGDIIDYYSKANYNYLKKSLKNINIPYIITCGNHESPSSIFDEITNNESDFKVINLKEFKLIGIDDSTKKVSKEILEKLKKELEDNIPIILCMHIPVLTKYNEIEMQKYDQYFIIDYKNCDDVTNEFLKLIIENKLVKAILCGHTHGASSSFFAKGKVQYCASSGLIGYVNNIIVK